MEVVGGYKYPNHLIHIHPSIPNISFNTRAKDFTPRLGMATDKLSADSVSGHPYPRLISDIRTRTRYPLWITNSIHIRYPRVTDIRGYIRLPTTHTTYLNPANSNMIKTYSHTEFVQQMKSDTCIKAYSEQYKIV